MPVYITTLGKKLSLITQLAARDEGFRAELIANPPKIFDEIGISVPKNVKLVVRTYNDNEWPLILPPLRSTEQPDERRH